MFGINGLKDGLKDDQEELGLRENAQADNTENELTGEDDLLNRGYSPLTVRVVMAMASPVSEQVDMLNDGMQNPSEVKKNILHIFIQIHKQEQELMRLDQEARAS